MEEQVLNAPDKAAKPGSIKVLCILSLIGGALWLIGSVITVVASDSVIGMVADYIIKNETPATELLDPAQQEMANQFAKAILIEGLGRYVIAIGVISILLSTASIIGVVFMWSLRKLGFWIYSVANLFALSGFIWISNWFGAFITLIFILLFFMNAKHLK